MCGAYKSNDFFCLSFLLWSFSMRTKAEVKKEKKAAPNKNKRTIDETVV